MDFESFLRNQLNEPQQQAATHERGPILVIAGAGSGKTRIITARIAHLLLNTHALPSSIVALTFTNKAAQEMRHRIGSFLGPDTELPFVGTFHAYCLRLLKINAHILGLAHFTILDSDDQLAMLKKLLERAGNKRLSARQAHYHIGLHKNTPAHSELAENSMLNDIYNAYEAEKRISNCLDFDDLLIKALDLFAQPAFAIRFRQQVRHVLVDEYQDTNHVQHELLKAMALDHKDFAIDSLCAVGDEDQSIYSWRGATVDNILSFATTFPDTTCVTVEQNYRSVQPILTVANTLIANNTNRNPKQLWSQRTGNNRIALCLCRSEHQEADLIAHTVKTRARMVDPTTIAVLYRTHAQSRTIEEALLKRSIPYRIVGGTQFYDRKEVKDILAYARLIANPYDRIAFNRAINCPPRRLGDAFIEQFMALWQAQPLLTYRDVAHKLLEEKTLATAQATSLRGFLHVLEQAPTDHLPHYIFEYLIKTLEYAAYLNDEYEPQEAESRLQNVQELINAAQFFQEQGVTTLEQLLQEIALLQDAIHQEKGVSCIQLMTLHAAKGLEFDTVIIAGLEEGLLPSTKSLDNESNIEEERRLLYVGMTRAQNYLLLTRTEFRTVYGNTLYQTASRFVAEMPTSLLSMQECTAWREMQAQWFAQQWFTGTPARPTIQIFSSQPTKSAAPKPSLSPHAVNKKESWKVYQPITHPTFGVGIIQAVETKENGKTYLTAQFKSGIKKIDSSFLA